MNGKMLGRISISAHNMPGHPCGECELGWPRGRRAQKRRENRAWRREVDLGMNASGEKRYIRPTE